MATNQVEVKPACEAGRTRYQRVSRFYPGYSEAGTSKQKDHCLKSNRGGATLRTFFWLADNAGIGTAPDPEEMDEQETPDAHLSFLEKCAKCAMCAKCAIPKNCVFTCSSQESDAGGWLQ